MRKDYVKQLVNNHIRYGLQPSYEFFYLLSNKDRPAWRGDFKFNDDPEEHLWAFRSNKQLQMISVLLTPLWICVHLSLPWLYLLMCEAFENDFIILANMHFQVVDFVNKMEACVGAIFGISSFTNNHVFSCEY